MSDQGGWQRAGGENSQMVEPNFDDPEGFIDEISNEDLLPDLLAKAPREADGIENVVIIDNIPKTNKLGKLKGKLQKIWEEKAGKPLNEEYPTEMAADPKTGEIGETTKGYCFLEFEDEETALKAQENLNNHRFDKKHVFAANLFTDFDKFSSTSDEWVEPTKKPFEEHGDLYQHMKQPDAMDQFVVTYEDGKMTEVYLNKRPEIESIFERSKWSVRGIDFSPTGKYLATYHEQGIAMWVYTPHYAHLTDSKAKGVWSRSHRFKHDSVNNLQFSPNERYIVTGNGGSGEQHSIVTVHDVLQQVEKRKFTVTNESGQLEWPHLKWSADSRFFARQTPDTISIYEVPHCGLLDKKSIKAPGIRRFLWSPKDNIISYWVPEHGEAPARVTLIGIPRRHEIRVKNLYNVHNIEMSWQDQGKFLAVRVDRPVKGKKSSYVSSFEIFHVKEKEVPVDTLEVKDMVTRFMWEPKGNRLCALHGEPNRVSCSIYNIIQGKVTVMVTIPELRSIDCIFWSPAGQYCVLAQLLNLQQKQYSSGAGSLMFLDTGVNSSNPADYKLSATEHPYATDVEWDPTGRYVVTYVSAWIRPNDNEYQVWSFLGRRVRKESKLNKLVQFVWRPRMPTLLTDKDIKNMKKEMKSYTREFENNDRAIWLNLNKEEVERRRDIIHKHNTWHKNRLDQINSANAIARRRALRDGVDTETDEADQEEVVIEKLIKEEEAVVDPATVGF